MKIVMLGHTGVGKTTYMASLYGALQNQINGFTLRAQSEQDHVQLMNLYHHIHYGTYPEATMQRGQYDFLLRYEGETAYPFTWVDYRGGALREQSDSIETQQLMQELKEAAGIVIFCDAAMSGGRVKIRSQFGRMMNLVQRAIQDDDSPTIIVIVFTKVDAVDELSDDLVVPAINLMKMIYSSEMHVGTVVGIACTEKQFVNVEIPALFVLHSGILFQSLRHSVAEDMYEKEAVRLQQAKWTTEGQLSDRIDRARGKPTYDDLANMAQQEAYKQRDEKNRLLNTLKDLGEILTGRLSLIVLGEKLRAFFDIDE